MTTESGRTARQDEVRHERRRRNDDTLDAGQARKLAIPAHIEAQLAAQGRTGRWVNDVGSSIEDRTVRDDWDKVEGVEPRTVVIDRKGTTAQTILLSKPKAFIAEDRAKKEAARRERERAMEKGQVPGAQPLPSDTFYADKANKIERGNQIL
jgi:hypothetical protein